MDRMPVPKARRDSEVPPIVHILEAPQLSLFELYRSKRIPWHLLRRFEELLWSYPFGQEPKRTQQSYRHTHPWHAEPEAALKLEMKYGDGYRDNRATMQREARISCRSKGISLDQICAIGERARDEWYIRLTRISALETIREKILPELDQERWPDALATRQKLAEKYLGPVIDEDAQEYCALIKRLVQLDLKIQPRLAMEGIAPRNGNYRTSSPGRPRPPAGKTRKELRKLKVTGRDIDRLLKAWSLSPLD